MLSMATPIDQINKQQEKTKQMFSVGLVDNLKKSQLLQTNDQMKHKPNPFYSNQRKELKSSLLPKM